MPLFIMTLKFYLNKKYEKSVRHLKLKHCIALSCL